MHLIPFDGQSLRFTIRITMHKGINEKLLDNTKNNAENRGTVFKILSTVE